MVIPYPAVPRGNDVITLHFPECPYPAGALALSADLALGAPPIFGNTSIPQGFHFGLRLDVTSGRGSSADAAWRTVACLHADLSER